MEQLQRERARQRVRQDNRAHPPDRDGAEAAPAAGAAPAARTVPCAGREVRPLRGTWRSASAIALTLDAEDGS